MKRRLVLATAIALIAASTLPVGGAPAQDIAKGWLGFAVTVESSGSFLNRIVLTVRVESVAPGSPAAGQGLAVGDHIVAIGPTKVAGARTSELGALMKRAVGESLQLSISRGGGEAHEVTLVAVAKP